MLRKRLNKHIYWNRLLPISWIKMTGFGWMERGGEEDDGGVKIGKSENPDIFIGEILGLLGYRRLTMSGISGNCPLMSMSVCVSVCMCRWTRKNCMNSLVFGHYENPYSERTGKNSTGTCMECKTPLQRQKSQYHSNFKWAIFGTFSPALFTRSNSTMRRIHAADYHKSNKCIILSVLYNESHPISRIQFIRWVIYWMSWGK